MTKLIEPVKAICGEKLQGQNRSTLGALKNPRIILLSSDQNQQLLPQQPHQILCKLCLRIKYWTKTYLHLNHPAQKIALFGALNEAHLAKLQNYILKIYLFFYRQRSFIRVMTQLNPV